MQGFMKKTMLAVCMVMAVADLLASTAHASDASDSKAMVTRFYQMVFEQHQVAKAFTLYVDPAYKQHNPRVADGAQAAIVYLGNRFKSNPQATNKIVRTIAEGDLVVLHVHSTQRPEDRGRAIVEIFRVIDNKIVEHWDVIQDIPETAANENGMF